ncbi:MAG: hypothetical protein ACI83B_000184 [Sediminicola sp.]|jgi:hypothetical protein|tara:strand:+ start:381 stop:1088 length:708 start_codon:yes stop_codon:yes gene_type:complete
MKKLLFTILVLVFTQNATAQFFNKERLTNLATFDNKLLSWGYFLGFNNYDFNFDYIDENGYNETDINVEGQTGFNVGLVGDLRINKFINLRLEPGLYFTQRNLIFPGLIEEKDFLREVKATYIHIPLLLKISTKRLNNFKPFVLAGISTSINLSSNEKNPDDNFQGEFRTTSNTNYYELGFGIDFYLFYFKFTPSIRGLFATSNELVQDNSLGSPWTGNISKMSTRAWVVNFTFQ